MSRSRPVRRARPIGCESSSATTGRVIAASLLLLALLAGMAGTTWGLVEARRQEREAKKQQRLAVAAERAEAKRAESERLAKLDAREKEKLAVAAVDKEREARLEEERQRKFAEAISRFVIDDFLALTSVEGQDRFGGEGREGLSKDTTLRELLDRAAEKLRARKDLDPRIEAELCWIVGVNYQGAGETNLAVAFLERAVQLRSDRLGRDDPDTLNAMNSLAVAYKDAGKIDLALPLFEETLELQKAKLGPDHPHTLTTMDNLALAYQIAGKLDQALPLAERRSSSSQPSSAPKIPTRSRPCTTSPWLTGLPASSIKHCRCSRRRSSSRKPS